MRPLPVIKSAASDIEAVKAMYDVIIKAFKSQSFVSRPVQRELLVDLVGMLLGEDYRWALVEASTGSGKTLILALAAYYFASQRMIRTIISTPRKDLQDDFMKEFTRVSKVLGEKVSVNVLKGRSNYLSKHRFELLYLEDYAKELRVCGLLELLAETAKVYNGDIEAVFADEKFLRKRTSAIERFGSQYASLATDITAENLGLSSELFGQSDDERETLSDIVDDEYYVDARKRAFESDIIIANHALLAMHIAGAARNKNGIIPDFENCNVVIDEAHAFERSVLGVMQKKFSVMKAVSAMKALSKLVPQGTIDMGQVVSDLTKLEKEGADIVSKYGKGAFAMRLSKDPSYKTDTLRLCDVADACYVKINMVLTGLFPQKQRGRPANFTKSKHMVTLRDERNQIAAFVNGIKGLIENRNPSVFFYAATLSQKRVRLSFERVSADVSQILKKYLWERARKVVAISGTLADHSGDDEKTTFWFHRNRLGVPSTEDHQIFQKVYEPAFKWNGVHLYISDYNARWNGEDRSDWNDEGYEAHREEHLRTVARDVVEKVVPTAKGGIVILTPANADVAVLERLFASKEFYMSRTLIIHNRAKGVTLQEAQRRLRLNPQNSVLITAGGWEGINLPGDDLTDLIITRVPFQQPHSPQMMAIRQKQKQSYKIKVSVKGKTNIRKPSTYIHTFTSAFIRFRQGLGRLCRKEGDTGRIFIFDSRVKDTEKYGAFAAYLKKMFKTTLKSGKK